MDEEQQELGFGLEGGAMTPPPVVASPEIVYQRSLRARHYRLTLRRDGVAVATIPAGGSEKAARAFVAQHQDWLERVRQRATERLQGPKIWRIGTAVLWRGTWETIETQEGMEARPQVRVGTNVFRVPTLTGDLRPTLEMHFQRTARIELPARTWELAAELGVDVAGVTVRNQRSRWGSCSSTGTISLNWRLVQTPTAVRDYIICHELMHRREMNHSPRFWTEVERVFPEWRASELWLKENGGVLGL